MMNSRKDLAEFQVGDRVVYRPYPGGDEIGIVTSINNSYVFVRYQGDRHAKATPAELLTKAGR